MRDEKPTSGTKRHPIKIVARRTGLSPEVLRVWEKRYHVVEPGRTDTGRRLYSDADIERLILLKDVIGRGLRIGEASALSNKDLKALISEDRKAEAPKKPSERDGESKPDAGVYLEECGLAVGSLDARRLRVSLQMALLELSLEEVVEDVVGPLLRTIGEMWAEHRLNPYHEHMASTLVRQTLDQVFAMTITPRNAPVIVATTPAGQRHEIGAIMAATTAFAEGWRVVYLGPDLPAEDIAGAARDTGAAAVALSTIYPDDDPKLGRELRRLREHLPEDVVIIVGGASAPAYSSDLKRAGAILVSSTIELRPVLSRIRQEKGTGE